ncbi:MAG TPA: hemerythrin domain-containing protein [Daejeonella sp.]|uniref:hemerythrin domain-containing protein n=1 Tax=Daejeonella sp. TaxID=2805397 RepID=UPI002EDB0D4F
MKRHEALIPLSRDHHGTLILARLLRSDAPPYKGLPHDAEGKAEYALKHYREELLEHFEQEEKMIPVLMGINPSLDSLLACMRTEHQELHSLFNSINPDQELSTQLDVIGRALESHVRKEDRVIFPLIQESCTEEVLNKLADIITEE